MEMVKYPKEWSVLSLTPSIRLELIEYVSDIAKWNDAGSHIKTQGPLNAIGFFYDTLALDKGSESWVGKIIFSDELSKLEDFIAKLSEHVNIDSVCDGLEPGNIASEVTESASKLLRALKSRGTPIFP